MITASVLTYPTACLQCVPIICCSFVIQNLQGLLINIKYVWGNTTEVLGVKKTENIKRLFLGNYQIVLEP